VNHKSSLQGIPLQTPLSGKPGYGKMPFPDSKSTAWDFFTGDKCTRAYRAAETLRPSLRNGFTAYNVLSPANGFLATVAARG
jgi:hypothetical protein